MERRQVAGDQLPSFGFLANGGQKNAEEYHPKRKAPASSWRSLHYRYPKTSGLFQIFVTAGFLALLIVRGLVAIGNGFSVSDRDSLSKVEDGGLANLYIDLADDQMKLNLLQRGEEKLQGIRQSIRKKGQSAEGGQDEVVVIPMRSQNKGSSVREELLHADGVKQTETKSAKEKSSHEKDLKHSKLAEKDKKANAEVLTQDQAIERMVKATRRDDPNAHTLGPEITDWNEQRAEWMAAHPDMQSEDPHKPKVLLITEVQPRPCKSKIHDHYLLKMIKNKADYARLHKLEMFFSRAALDPPMSHFWAKLPIIRKMMLMRPDVEWIFWMDSDAMFTDMVFEIPFEKYEPYNLVMWGYNEGVYQQRSWVACNTGVFFIRNNQWTLDLLEEWSHMGPEGQVRVEAGRVLSSYLATREPDMVADDQSALVFLMLTRPELRPGIFLEWDFSIVSHWADIVNKFEDLSSTSRIGAGDVNWPLTTQFTGCQPCNSLSDQIYKSCLDGIERTFNFGDNQVLRHLGFEHESLQAAMVRRLRNETLHPLVTVPVHNPWVAETFN